MTKKLLAASICSLLLLAPACGSGGDGGGTAPPQASGPAAKVVECLAKDKVKANVDKAGAKLIRAPKARDAVVAQLKGNTVNILLFAEPDDASETKAQIKDEDRVNIEKANLIVYQKAPTEKQDKLIEDCLPKDKEEEK
jgi:hypothetical protein